MSKEFLYFFFDFFCLLWIEPLYPFIPACNAMRSIAGRSFFFFAENPALADRRTKNVGRCECGGECGIMVSMRILRLNHSVYQIEYHMVWGTKYRRKILKPYVKTVLLDSFQKTEFLYPTLHIAKVNTADDHVHLLLEVAPSVSVAAMVQKLKSHSSHDLKKRFRFIREMDDGSGIWSVGYFCSTVGLNEKMIEKYIHSQDKKDRPQNARLGF